jgi:hypothetical protein
MVCRLASITLRSADAVSPLPDLRPFSFKLGVGSPPVVTGVGSLSVLFMMISSGVTESVHFEIRIQHSSPGLHKPAVNKQVEKQSIRLAESARHAHLDRNFRTNS